MALAAERGEKVVRAELVRAFEYLGIGIANAITTLHPDMVVLGGGLAEIGPLLFETVTKVVLKRVRMFPAGGVRIEKSLVGDNAALLGGLALAAQTAVERGTLHREP
jgi:glucokinase